MIKKKKAVHRVTCSPPGCPCTAASVGGRAPHPALCPGKLPFKGNRLLAFWHLMEFGKWEADAEMAGQEVSKEWVFVPRLPPCWPAG